MEKVNGEGRWSNRINERGFVVVFVELIAPKRWKIRGVVVQKRS